MKYGSLLLVTLFLLPACNRNSATESAAPAAVSETTATTAMTDTTATQADGTRTNVIKERSKIEWVGAKVTRDHNGSFQNFDGSISYVGGKPTDISFEIDVNSIQSDDEKLTGHLKSPDFFDVAKYPKATFTSTSLTEEPGANGQTHMLRGTLELHGVKKELAIPVKAEQTPEGVHATSEFTINRHDWGISYRGMADDLIKDNVLIRLDLMFPPPPTVA
jgi:polyisoprenoid-binding protein YceI